MAFIYVDKPEILKRCDARLVAQLSNDDDRIDYNDPASIDGNVLEAMENDAALTVDNFLRGIYVLPLSGDALTAEIKGIVAQLTFCNLWARRGEEPEAVSQLRERLFKRLEAMGKQDSPENRAGRDPSYKPVRSTGGRVSTLFDHCGYFDGLPFMGVRTLPKDTEGGTGV